MSPRSALVLGELADPDAFPLRPKGLGVLGAVRELEEGLDGHADGVAEATSPMLIGYLRDVTGNYDLAYDNHLKLQLNLGGAASTAFVS